MKDCEVEIAARKEVELRDLNFSSANRGRVIMNWCIVYYSSGDQIFKINS